MQFNDKGPRSVYNIDLDGTLTMGEPFEPFWEKQPTPFVRVIEAVRKLYSSGNIIIIWKARQRE